MVFAVAEPDKLVLVPVAVEYFSILIVVWVLLKNHSLGEVDITAGQDAQNQQAHDALVEDELFSVHKAVLLVILRLFLSGYRPPMYFSVLQ